MRKNNDKTNDKTHIKKVRGKIYFILVVFIASFFVLSGRVYYIKLVKGEEYEKKARMQHVSQNGIIIPASRGSILDRNRQSLAVSTTVYNVIIDPFVLSKSNEEGQLKTVDTLSVLLKIDKSEIEIYREKDADGNLTYTKRYYILANKIPAVLADEIKKEKLAGVFLEQDSIRSYVHDSMASHVIGFMRSTNRWGLESFYDKELTGTPGRSFSLFDEESDISTQVIEPVHGYSLITTIDQSIQQFAEDAVMEANLSHIPRNASIIVMNPNTGEVLAMASYPTFNANAPMVPILNSNDDLYHQWESFDESERVNKINQIWDNYNVMTTFEPGSIFKPIVVASALNENIIKVTDYYNCEGVRKMYDKEIGCWNRYGHGGISVENSLAESCNLAMITIAQKMGPELFYKYQRDFGFGETTDIDLPQEVSAKDLMYTPENLRPVELATASFGQTFNCTPIQILNALCTVINGGNLMRPYAVSQIIDSDGKVVRENSPYIQRKVISQETSDTIRTFLRSTIDSPKGTGKKAKIEGYSIGGKTGTAEQGVRGSDQYVLSFVAFMPVDNPQIAAIAIIDRPKYYSEDQSGSSSAAPMLKGLLENIITYMNIQPTHDISNITSTNSGNTMVTVKNYINKSIIPASIEIINSGLDYILVGSGNIVTNQTIKEGAEVEPGSVITLYLTENDGATGEIVKVPDVHGFSFEEAITTLVDAGLSPVSPDGNTGTVIEQSYRPGIMVERNSEIILTFE